MKLVYIFCLPIVLLLGCGYMSQKKYHIGHPFNFISKADFMFYLKKKNAIPLQQYLYVDSVSYSKFVFNQLKQNQSGLYLGAFLCDSISIKQNSLLQKNTSCSGRIEKEILSILSMKNYPDSLLQKSFQLSEYKLRFLESGEVFDIKKCKEKITILLIYSYAMGNYYEHFFHDIQSLKNVFVICVDPVYRIK